MFLLWKESFRMKRKINEILMSSCVDRWRSKMCLILFAYQVHPEYPLILAANRDEFYERPSRSAYIWPEEILAGQDEKEKGTWLGFHREGKFAAITNYRDGKQSDKKNAPSRGELAVKFLKSNGSQKTFAHWLQENGPSYNGFNLIFGDRKELWYYSNQSNKEAEKLSPGIYGLSNHLLNTPWPKVVRGKEYLSEELNFSKPDFEKILNFLANEEKAPEEKLPQTNIKKDWEKLLSSIFICAPLYGTRCSTVALWDKEGNLDFWERTFSPQKEQRTIHFHWKEERK